MGFRWFFVLILIFTWSCDKLAYFGFLEGVVGLLWFVALDLVFCCLVGVSRGFQRFRFRLIFFS